MCMKMPARISARRWIGLRTGSCRRRPAFDLRHPRRRVHNRHRGVYLGPCQGDRLTPVNVVVRDGVILIVPGQR